VAFLAMTSIQFIKTLFSAPVAANAATPEGRSLRRYRRIAINSLTSCLARGIAMLVSLITVPVTLGYLGKQEFGFYTAVISFVTWLALFDFGVVNGLVNSIAEAYGRDNRQAARVYVSTAFFLLVAIAVGVLAIFLILMPRIGWDSVMGVAGQLSSRIVMWSIVAAMAPVIAGLPLSIVRQIYAGYQKSYISTIFNTSGAVLSLGTLVVAVKMRAGLPVLILAFGAGGVAASVCNLAYLVLVEMPWLFPKLTMCSMQGLKRLMRTSLPLFSYQVGSLLVNQSQPIILAHRTSLECVADYGILMRVCAAISGVIILGTNSFVPPFREAFERGDSGWLRRAFKRMLMLRMGLASLACCTLLLFGNAVLRVWLRTSTMQFDLSIWIALSVSVLSATWITSHTDLLTILDHIWIQVGLVFVNGFVTVALTVVLSPRLGIWGAFLALNSVSLIMLSWLVPRIARSTVSRLRSRISAGDRFEVSGEA
jgi:O-antigen/teichoic acid export membrane protein